MEAQKSTQVPRLADSFGRMHNYLRISLIDSCNFTCTYCVSMQKPAKTKFSNLMSADEIETIAGMFVSMGVNKIRLTGGEPLLRHDFTAIIHRLSKLPVHLTLTTNGYLLDQYMDDLSASGIDSLNMSLDTFQKEKFEKIARFDGLEKVYSNLFALMKNNFHVKLNMVLMRGVNDDEINDFVEFSRKYPVHVRFIEYMPFTSNDWSKEKVYPAVELIEHISSSYTIEKLPDAIHDTARKYRVDDAEGTFAIISTVSEPFCSGCNRLRLTADGKMRNCLFSKTHNDLLTPFRKGEDIMPLILENLKGKFAEYGGQKMNNSIENSNMILIGG